MSQDYDNRVLRRILSILVHKIISNYESAKEILPTELLEIMLQLGMPNPDKIVFQAIYSSIELQKAFEKDTFNGYLVFLQEFINKVIEEDLLNNNFDITETFVTNSRFVAELTQTDLKLYQLLKNSYGVRESTKQISEVIEMKDEDYNNAKSATTSILRQCLMRSAFLLMSDEVIADINYEFHNFIENEKYCKRHPNDHISEEIVIKCFKAIKKDRNKPIVLSLEYGNGMSKN